MSQCYFWEHNYVWRQNNASTFQHLILDIKFPCSNFWTDYFCLNEWGKFYIEGIDPHIYNRLKMTVQADLCGLVFFIIAYHGASDSMYRPELGYLRWWNSGSEQVVVVLYCVAVIVYNTNLMDALDQLIYSCAFSLTNYQQRCIKPNASDLELSPVHFDIKFGIQQ